MHRHAWILALVKTSLKVALSRPWASISAVLAMAANNLLWFGLFGIFMGAVGSIRDWRLSDIAVLTGFGSVAFGLAFVLTGGALEIARMIRNGEIDVHLTHPRPPLVAMILRQADMECLGDMASGVIILVGFGQLGFWANIGMLGLSVVAAVIYLAMCILIHSLAFRIKSQHGVQQAFDSFVLASSMPAHGLPLWLRTVLLTVFPAGLITLLPVELVREFAVWKLAAMILAAAVLSFLAVWIFHRGLRRYTSGSQMTEMR